MFYGSFCSLSFGAGGCASIVSFTVVVKWFDKNVGKTLGLVACGIGASGLIIPLVVRPIDIYHWWTTLVILGLGMSIWECLCPLSSVTAKWLCAEKVIRPIASF